MKNKSVYLSGFKDSELGEVIETVNSIPGYQCSMNRNKCQIFLLKDLQYAKDLTRENKRYYQFDEFLARFSQKIVKRY